MIQRAADPSTNNAGLSAWQPRSVTRRHSSLSSPSSYIHTACCAVSHLSHHPTSELLSYHIPISITISYDMVLKSSFKTMHKFFNKIKLTRRHDDPPSEAESTSQSQAAAASLTPVRSPPGNESASVSTAASVSPALPAPNTSHSEGGGHQLAVSSVYHYIFWPFFVGSRITPPRFARFHMSTIAIL